MLLQIPEVLTVDQVTEFNRLLKGADWIDGKVTAGHQSAKAKYNLQLPEDLPIAKELGARIIEALNRSPLFMSAALPLKIFPPLFNRYETNGSFGSHIDNAIRQVAGTPHRVRTDISATLFLNNPDDYEGGELLIEDTYGVHRVKLPAGHLILYPAGSLHQVTPVTRGFRLASFFWIQSMVREDEARTLLFDLDMAVQQFQGEHPEHSSILQLTGVYHNLLRRWADI